MNVFEPFNRYRWKLHFNKLKDEILIGSIPEPIKVTIELTLRCNLSCRMCFRDKESKSELTFQQLVDVISGFPSSVEEVHLIGGEVFLRDDIFKIISHIDSAGFKIRVHSNGTLLTDQILERLSKFDNLRGIGFSIDGLEDLHNKIRGSKNAYERTMRAIKGASRFFQVSVNTVLLDENFHQIPEVFDTLMEMGMSEYRIEPEMFCTQSEVNRTPVGPIAANIKENGVYKFTATELLDLKKLLDEKAKKNGIRVVLAPRIAEIDSQEFISGRVRERKKLFCKHLLVPRIDSEGSLVFCHIIKKRFGSLLEHDLNSLWNKSDLINFRKDLLKNNLYPVCKRCCRLRSI